MRKWWNCSGGCHPRVGGDPETKTHFYGVIIKRYFVYILCSKRNGTLYVGVTSDLARRVYEHREKMLSGSFTKQYGVDKLVYVEEYRDVDSAIHREKCLKKWNRKWNLRLIEEQNPD